MEKLIFEDKIFDEFQYSAEEDFEKDVIKHSKEIFGSNSLYIDIKKRIGEDNILSIPDGYLLDFSFESQPRLYIIENELVSHDPFKHIGQQLLKFAISYKKSGRNIKTFLLDEILKDSAKKEMVEKNLKSTNYRNIDDFLENIIFEKEVGAIIIIDEITEDLENVLSNLTMKTDILEFRAFVCGEQMVHEFTPFQQELTIESEVKTDDIDTIVVPANEDGFKETFLGEDCWYAIRIYSSMIERIKYIAGYQTAPTSAITHYAEVKNIEKYEKTGKYVLHFKDKAKRIGPLKLVTKADKGRVKALQAPRYTSFKKLIKAKNLDEVFI